MVIFSNHAMQVTTMPSSQFQLIDLLEVYHAKALQTALLRQVRRLRDEEQGLPGSDRLRREEVSAFYESMLLTSTQLLQVLGDLD